MKMYYEDDVDASIVADKTIAVMGYGSQGTVHPGRKLLMTA